MEKRSTGAARLIVLALLIFVLLGLAAVWVNRVVEKRSYALPDMAQIKTRAQEYELDAFLVAAVIYAESSGNANAVSPKGAVGLMQIMPTTGQWVADKMDMQEYEESSLTDPSVNMRLGCWYLAYLFDKYDANLTHALAAYNAGPGNVDKWLKDDTFSRDGELIQIPFAQTARYVEKVAMVREKYLEYYEDELS